MSLRQTPLYEAHRKHGGKIVEFGGWLLPVQYTGIIEEHHAVREKAGLFDVSHMGEVKVKGRDALNFLQRMVTNDVSHLADGQILYTPMCYPDGGTVDDLLIYKQGDFDYQMVINAANIEKDWDWLLENSKNFNVDLADVSDETAELALQGPLAAKILNLVANKPVDGIQYYWFTQEISVAGKPVLASRTGYTGEDGFELYCRPGDAVFLWEAILAAGRPLGMVLAGLGCRDTLRFEACMPLYGHELSADISPLEAGLGRFVKLEKVDFIGRAVLAEQRAEGTNRKLAGFAVTGRGVARAGYPVLSKGRAIGKVTSGSYAPTLDQNLGIAMVESEYAGQGQIFDIEIRGQNVPAEVIPRPFYKRKG